MMSNVLGRGLQDWFVKPNKATFAFVFAMGIAGASRRTDCQRNCSTYIDNQHRPCLWAQFQRDYTENSLLLKNQRISNHVSQNGSEYFGGNSTEDCFRSSAG